MSFDWTSIGTAIPDMIKSLFGIIDKTITDKDENIKAKGGVLDLIAGKDAKYWIPANAFFLAMLVNFAMVEALTFLDRPVPKWSLYVVLFWMIGPLLSTLSKEAISAVFEIMKQHEQYKKEQKK